MAVALALGLAVTAAACGLYRPARDAFEDAADRATLDDAAQTAFALIADSARLAGLATDAGTSPPRAAQSLALRWPVFGCADGRPAGPADAPACSPGGSETGDGVQFVAMPSDVADWTDSEHAVTDCLGQALAAGAPNLARFYIAGNGADNAPGLDCDGSGRLGDPQPLVAGIETLQLSYWLTGADQAVRTVAPSDWKRVRAVTVCLVARGAQTHAHFPYTDCSGVRQPGTDGYRRRAYTLLVALRNVVLRP
jgi:type IV pilus assembly protein PilW